MKQYITMEKNKQYDMYKSLEAGDSRFISLWQIFSDKFEPHELIDWFMNEKRTVDGNELVDIRKEDGKIILHDMSDSAYDDMISPYELDPTKKFEMSPQNFIEMLVAWEKLRMSRPDTILIVIHEDNHVSLEIDPVIIKEYQDAGYAFDIDKKIMV